MKEKLHQIIGKRHALLISMIVPARAAANQMKDAGMHRGADQLMQILFELDALDEELKKTVTESPAQSLDAIMEMFKDSRGQ